jgi:hypothetical protein
VNDANGGRIPRRGIAGSLAAPDDQAARLEDAATAEYDRVDPAARAFRRSEVDTVGQSSRRSVSSSSPSVPPSAAASRASVLSPEGELAVQVRGKTGPRLAANGLRRKRAQTAFASLPRLVAESCLQAA